MTIYVDGEGGSVRRGWARTLAVASTTSVLLSVALMSSPLAGAAHAPALDQPLGIAASGGHVWVANARGDSVSEFDVTSGALVRTIPRSTYGFATPIGIGTNRSNVWVANKSANSLTEL
ncbi:MAG TPA: hypothetical protein VK704_01695, partial [Acidimicrobiales bacterium]|nr:hypothetical protein [Acidimicrobiales bacterium]